MAEERFARLQELFHAASALPPGQRREYLESVCGGDDSLRDETLALVDAWEAGEDRLAAEVQSAASTLEREGLGGGRIGPYQILRELGAGGMGVVYLALRDDDVYRKRVAIKVATLPGGREQARLTTERQILATLEHPGIARLIDGGTTDLGRPYLVMEYVEGEPIDKYCDRLQLGTEERIELFRAVCDAVHYAHQNLVVHRDLKPGNILVTGSGEPKLLDFGIAKLLAPDVGAGQPLTATGLRPMTPEYASPEQVRGQPVTTASDVYSLGVVLYELLTGRVPFRLKGQPLEAVERAITDRDPVRPSSIAPQGRRLRGDLDNIVLVAMNKSPVKRYASALQLSEDLRRHLQGEPVIARRPTWSYLAGKFVGRNRVGLGIAAAFIALILGFAVNRAKLASDLEAERDLARRETQTAESISAFLQDLFRASHPGTADSDTARQLMDRAVVEARSQLRDEPEARAALLETLASVYANQGAYDKAEPLLAEALGLREARFGPASAQASSTREALDRMRATARSR